jgi:hypothetical protein
MLSQSRGRFRGHPDPVESQLRSQRHFGQTRFVIDGEAVVLGVAMVSPTSTRCIPARMTRKCSSSRTGVRGSTARRKIQSNGFYTTFNVAIKSGIHEARAAQIDILRDTIFGSVIMTQSIYRMKLPSGRTIEAEVTATSPAEGGSRRKAARSFREREHPRAHVPHRLR